jgi:hypothetical protein
MDRLIATNSVPFASADTAPASGTPQYATNGNPATGVAATEFPAYAWNMLQDEIYNVIIAAGLTPNRNAWNQLLTALQTMLQTQTNTAFTTGGTAPAFTLTPTTPLTALTANQRFRVNFNAAGTTGSNTLNVSGLGAVALKQFGPGGALVNGVVPAAGFLTDIEYNGTVWVILDPIPTGTLINVQTFTATGAFTYTPTPGATTAIADVQAGGGQGGGSAACTASQNSFGTGAHSGSRAVVRFSLSGVGTIAGTVGAGGSTSGAGAAGQTGGTSSLGTLASCPGGPGGGVLGPTTGAFIGGNSSTLPSPTIGSVLETIYAQSGNPGQYAICIAVGTAISGAGGISPGYSGGILGGAGTGPGNPGYQIGMGGSGAFTAASGAAQVGGAGTHGQVTIYEYA